ncbi:hypothetical protein CJF42_02765 [Pseudoalteromonas sp. NBT06-2]|uniref:TnsA endonuclease N-terminal domain-containing protein n=1 Tax=Pseudoalteromonas sp. NBT06-2 TaxID=2025950 RepID=UPI000BA4EBC4|nr:TnsA endonuclease N-terminal domain-containing protein [Pseudoalteromonas sp. NBT06-2]PAJ75963.1 hypothetical protein CJF42_02765 [Pseudoalteromonas sp. NBT06-2]
MNSNQLVGHREKEQLSLDLVTSNSLVENSQEPYKSGLTVQDFSSEGQAWRVYSRTTGRVHQYFSKLEYCTHLLLDLNPNVIDIKDQYPHDLSLSLELTQKLGINHPPQNAKEKKPLTTDLVAVFSGLDGPNKTVGIYVKYAKDFNNFRTVEKLHLERESLAQLGISMLISSEESIDKVIMKSIDWILSVHTSQMEGELSFDYAAEMYELLQANPAEKLTTVLNQLDRQGEVEDGYHLMELKCLLQFGYLSFDLTKNVLFLSCEDIELTPEVES